MQETSQSCQHFEHYLTESDRHFIYSPEYNNCLFCLVNSKGPMSQEEIAVYLGLSKMRICQIEKIALEKFKTRMSRVLNNEKVLGV